MDFSKPRLTGEALAEVVFEQDISKWFTVSGEKLEFKATSKLELRILDAHDKGVAKTLDDFMKDLKKDELSQRYAAQIDSVANYQAGIASYLLLGLTTTLLLQHMERSGQKTEYLNQLMNEIQGNITVTHVQQ